MSVTPIAPSQTLRHRPIRLTAAAWRPATPSWLATRQAPAATLGEGLKRLEDLAATPTRPGCRA